jgi:hypothetical protein
MDDTDTKTIQQYEIHDVWNLETSKLARKDKKRGRYKTRTKLWQKRVVKSQARQKRTWKTCYVNVTTYTILRGSKTKTRFRLGTNGRQKQWMVMRESVRSVGSRETVGN